MEDDEELSLEALTGKSPRKTSRKWDHDPVLLKQVTQVADLWLGGMSKGEIAAKLDISYGAVTRAIERASFLWREQAAGDLADIRARTLHELNIVKNQALKFAGFDMSMELAIMTGRSLKDPDTGDEIFVFFGDEEGGKRNVQFRGQKATALNVARQAIMDMAKIQGAIVDKVSPTSADGGTTLNLADLVVAAQATIQRLGLDSEEEV